MAPDGFTPYEYVEDGACAEPWLDTRPWTSVRFGELGLHSFLFLKSTHKDPMQVAGACATRIALWVLEPCVTGADISLPGGKIYRGQDISGYSIFRPRGDYRTFGSSSGTTRQS